MVWEIIQEQTSIERPVIENQERNEKSEDKLMFEVYSFSNFHTN